MTKQEMIKAVCSKVDGATQKDIDAIITSLSEVITEELQAGGEVTIPGAAKFSAVDVPERRGVSALGEKKEWVKPAHKAPKAKIVKALKDALL